MSLSDDQLFIESRQYGVESMARLPKSVHPSTVTDRQVERWMDSGRISSEFEPLTISVTPLLSQSIQIQTQARV